MSTTTVRELNASDSARIQCQTMDREFNTCGEPAVVVHQIDWNTGNTEGVSFSITVRNIER